MAAYEQEWRWGGWRLGLGLAFLVLIATERVISFKYDFPRAWGPALAVCWYLTALVFVNRSRLRIDGEGVRFTYGPLPSGARNRHFPAADIARVYGREYGDLSRYGGYFKSVGIETRSGFAFDLEREELPALTIQERGEAVAAALGWRGGLVAISGGLPGRPVQGWREQLPVVVALALSGCWVLWVFR